MDDAKCLVDQLWPEYFDGWKKRKKKKRIGCWIHRRKLSVVDKKYYDAVANLDRIRTDATYFCPRGGFVYTAERGDGHGEAVGERPATPSSFWLIHEDDDFALTTFTGGGGRGSPPPP